MGFFDDDPFEDLVREFFGGRNRPNSGQVGSSKGFIEGEEEDRNIDFIDGENLIYVIFEIPGYGEKDVVVLVKGNCLEVNIGKKDRVCDVENVQSYLTRKLCNGIKIRKTLPKSVNPKNFKYSVKNGILEIVFSKK